MRVSDILRGKAARLVTAAPSASAAYVGTLMKREGVGAVVICDAGRHVLGVLSERDLALAVARLGTGLFRRTAGQLMSASAPSVRPGDSVIEVMRAMTELRARHAPVVEHGVLVGMVSIGDLLKARLAEKAQENAVLQDVARSHLAA